MGQALYRKYRSKTLDEIVGQEHITRTLRNAIDRNAVSHAYLLTGPHGVGKTSIARILAHEINQLPYESEQVHLDIIEIDAASNRRIDEIRDLRDKVHTAPARAAYKVYIIDEVHMLTKEAFNALLKTLEEPPKHVIFILATTDVHKLPETIISRTQHFSFKPIPSKQIADHLSNIAKTESLVIDKDSIELIAQHGNGSFRDSIGLLEQASKLSDKVTVDQVRDMIGVPPESEIQTLVEHVLQGSHEQIVSTLENLQVQGYLAEEISSQIAQNIRGLLLEKSLTLNSDTKELLKDLIEVPASRDPETLLEIALISYSPGTPAVIKSAPSSGFTSEPKPKNTSVAKVIPNTSIAAAKPTQPQPKHPEPKLEQVDVSAKTPKPAQQANSAPVNQELSDDTWHQVLERLKGKHSTLYSIARMAEFEIREKDILLLFKFPFHKKRIESSKNQTILHELFLEITGKKPVLLIELLQDTKQAAIKPQPVAEEQSNAPLETISNIFGGGEVLES